jgi:predicted metal-dependent hydrolase
MSDGEIIQTIAGPCRLLRRERKTLGISIHPDGQIELQAPSNATVEALREKVAKRLAWITATRRGFSAMNRNRLPLRYESGATHRYLGKQYRLKVYEGRPSGVRLKGGFLHVWVPSKSPKLVAMTLDQWIRERARVQFTRRLSIWNDWCLDRGLPLPELRLMKMPKRWGSAHSNGRIYLNPSLVKAPSRCIDYVLAHEVCHLRYPSHSRHFFSLLGELVPDWPALKLRLEQLD